MSDAPKLTWQERFWRSVRKTETCWLWTASLDSYGYGHMSIRRHLHTTHRVSWCLHYGPVPRGKHVLHTCDVRNCVNPSHLWIGTHRDNILDMFAKKRRILCGSQSPTAKLTDAQVIEIRRLRREGQSYSMLAKQFGMSKSHMANLSCGRAWKHLLVTAND